MYVRYCLGRLFVVTQKITFTILLSISSLILEKSEIFVTFFLIFLDPTFVQSAVQALGKSVPKFGERVKGRVVLTRSAPFFYVTMCIKHPHNYAGQVDLILPVNLFLDA